MFLNIGLSKNDDKNPIFIRKPTTLIRLPFCYLPSNPLVYIYPRMAEAIFQIVTAFAAHLNKRRGPASAIIPTVTPTSIGRLVTNWITDAGVIFDRANA